MIGLIQRVTHAGVRVDDRVVAEIGRGLLAFVGVERDDTGREAERLLRRMIGYRVFPDETGRMNLSLTDVGGSILLVPQFTLAADTRKGTRASFGSAADPEAGEALFRRLVESAREAGVACAAGEFGSHMKVTLVNDGPVTFLLQARPKPGPARRRGTV